MEALQSLFNADGIPYTMQQHHMCINDGETIAECFAEGGFGIAHYGPIGGTQMVNTAQEAFEWMTNANAKMKDKAMMLRLGRIERRFWRGQQPAAIS